jgi:thioredoxin 1
MDNNMPATMVNDENFAAEVEQSDKPVLLAIGASWCVDCKRIMPLFMQFAAQHGEKLKFCACDMEQSPAVKERFAVRHIPTLVHIKSGKIVDTLIEPKSIAPFKEFVEKALV